MKLLNDSRARAVVAGALGGGIGWTLSQSVGSGEDGFTNLQTVIIGGMVGLAIASLLGSAEGLLLRSRTIAFRGAMIGVLIGGIAGTLGSSIGQLSYLAATGSESEGSSGKNVNPRRSLFSPQMRQRFEEAGAKVGDVEIGLSWENLNDLDLHVVDPNGEQIFFGHKISASKGELDVDRNVRLLQATTTPVEHVYWPKDGAPEGSYRVFVNFYTQHRLQPSSTDFKVEVLSSEGLRTFTGNVNFGDAPQLVHTFNQDNTPAVEETKHAGVPLLALAGLIFGWTVFGGLVGIAEGIRRKSGVAMRNASIGGTVGGALGGIAFVMLVAASPTSGRLFGFVVLGVCIGLSMVLVDRVLSAALRVRNGKYEGREIMLDRPEMRIGRNEMFEVYLGGDTGIAMEHAVLRTNAGRHSIHAVDGSVSVNNNICSSKELADGDIIEVGSTRLAYVRKGSNLSPSDSQATSLPKRTPAPPAPRRGGTGKSTISNSEQPVEKGPTRETPPDSRTRSGPPTPRR